MSDAPAAVARPSRRAVLAAAPASLLAAALGGCTADGGPDGAPAPTPSPDPDDALREAAAERERGLLREYDAVLAAVPALAERLTPLRTHHDEHLTALLGASGGASASGPGSAPASATASPTGTPAGAPVVPVPADPAAALARLVAAERAAGAAHAQDCLAASRALAPVLATLSASELSHPVALT